MAFNARAVPHEMARLADALGAPDGDPASALWDLAVASNVPITLSALGLQRADLDEAADRAFAEIKINPVPLTRNDLYAILERAHTGTRPTIAT